MIIFDGIKYYNKIPFIKFKNEDEKSIEIPLDVLTADRITKYISKITKGTQEPLESK